MEKLKNLWKIEKLEDICKKIFSGGTPNTKEKEFWDGGIPWLSSGETRNKYIKYTEKTISEKGVNSSSTKLAIKNDIIIASAGQGFTRGQTSYCLIDTYINQSIISLRADNKKVNPKYLFFNISSRYNELRHLSDGNASRGSLTTKILKELEIHLPPLEIQDKIASILSALDDKIEINNEMNKTLEEMAQTLFKRWFIDFDFPNENGEPYKSNGGKMVDSELGEIPEGWGVYNLGDLFKFIKGKKPKIVSENLSKETPLKYLTIKGFNGDENLYASEDKIILIDKEDIVMVMDGASSGDVYIGKAGVLGSTFSKIEKTKKINWSYIYLILKYYESDIKSHITGSAIPHTDKGYVEKIRVSLPNLELVNILNKELSKIIKRKLINQEENQSLIMTRDILLPKLMNGEIEV